MLHNSVSDIACCLAAGLCCLIDFLPSRIDTLRDCSGWQIAQVDLAGSLKTVNPGVVYPDLSPDLSERRILFKDRGTVREDQGARGHFEVRVALVFFPQWDLIL